MQKFQTIPENTKIVELHTLLYWNKGGLNYSWYGAIPGDWERRTILKQTLLLFLKIVGWADTSPSSKKNLLKFSTHMTFPTTGKVQEGMFGEAHLFFLVWPACGF